MSPTMFSWRPCQQFRSPLLIWRIYRVGSMCRSTLMFFLWDSYAAFDKVPHRNYCTSYHAHGNAVSSLDAWVSITLTENKVDAMKNSVSNVVFVSVGVQGKVCLNRYYFSFIWTTSSKFHALMWEIRLFGENLCGVWRNCVCIPFKCATGAFWDGVWRRSQL